MQGEGLGTGRPGGSGAGGSGARGRRPAASPQGDGWPEGRPRWFRAALCWLSPPDPFPFCSAGLQ